MSDDSSNSKLPAKRRINWRKAGLYIAWGTLSFLVVQFGVAVLIGALAANSWLTITEVSPVAEVGLGVLVYSLILALVIIVPRHLWGERTTRREVGLDRLVAWLDIALAPLAFLAYIILTGTLILWAKQIIPGFDIDQAQEVGFENLVGVMDCVLAFVLLVGAAPIAEEVLFRGWLQGKLKSSGLPFILNMLIVSLLFGVAHMQWNVGVDTFALSLVLCALREWTGSIWAGILLHMVKNGIAYYFLFIAPLGGMAS